MTPAQHKVLKYLIRYPGDSSRDVANALYPRVRNGEAIASKIMDRLTAGGYLHTFNVATTKGDAFCAQNR
jgi:hypothetical protein